MQQSIQLGQVVQPSMASSEETIVKNLKQQSSAFVSTARAWWNAESETFTRICATDEGETFTHGEVVLAHLATVALLLISMVAEWLEGGAL